MPLLTSQSIMSPSIKRLEYSQLLTKRIYHDPKPNDFNEERFIIIGTVDKRMLFVVFTKEGNDIVIISARRLTKRQQERFNL